MLFLLSPTSKNRLFVLKWLMLDQHAQMSSIFLGVLLQPWSLSVPPSEGLLLSLQDQLETYGRGTWFHCGHQRYQVKHCYKETLCKNSNELFRYSGGMSLNIDCLSFFGLFVVVSKIWYNIKLLWVSSSFLIVLFLVWHLWYWTFEALPTSIPPSFITQNAFEGQYNQSKKFYFYCYCVPAYLAVWPEKNRQMSIKIA